MERWAFFVPDTELTPIARLIMWRSIAGLNSAFGKEWKLRSAHSDPLVTAAMISPSA